MWSTPERKNLTLIAIIRRLVQEMARQVVVADPQVHAVLQQGVKRLLQQLDDSDEDPGRQAEAALRLVRDYNIGLNDMVRNVSGALPEMLSRFTSSLELVHSRNESMLKRLDRLQRSLDSSGSESDFQTVRAELAGWLNEARIDTLEQSVAVSDGIGQFTEDCKRIIETSRQAAALRLNPEIAAEKTDPLTDPLTGLPGRRYAEAMLARLVKQEYSYAAVFHLDRLQVIRDRYGFRGRDQLVLQFSQYLGQTLCDANSLFRWTDSAFLGVVPESSATEETTHVEDLRKLALSRHVCDLDFGGRAALVPITFRFKLWYASGMLPESLTQEIDAFVVQQPTAG